LREDPVRRDGGEEDRDGVVVGEREEICRTLRANRRGYAQGTPVVGKGVPFL
jgi:hypothetical protein